MTTLTDTYGGSNAIAQPTQQGFTNTLASNIQATPTINKNPFEKEEKIKDTTNKFFASDEIQKIFNNEKWQEKKAEEKIKALEEKEKAELERQMSREDNAYQRAIADMRKAGWNTDGLTPQASASNAKLDTSRSEGEKERINKFKMLIRELQIAQEQGDKERENAIIIQLMKSATDLTVQGMKTFQLG